MVFVILSIISFIGSMSIEQPPSEQYFQWASQLTGLQYARWWIFLDGNKKIDCSWLPIVFWEKMWLWDSVEKRQHTNSYKLFLMWKKRDSYFDIRRGDTIFFLPHSWSDYHIAFAWTWVSNNTLPIFDFVQNKHLGKVTVRDLSLHKCWRSYCYTNKRRILNRTNIFDELLSNNNQD